MSELPGQEREQIAQLLQRIITDAEFRTLFLADPAQAIESSGAELSHHLATRIIEGMDLLPQVTAHAAAMSQAQADYAIVIRM